MENFVKTVSFTAEEWRSMDLQKGDLIWISETQGYAGEATEGGQLPFTTTATMSLVEKVYRFIDDSIQGASIYSMIRGVRGNYGVHKEDILCNLTQEYKKHFAARKIQTRFRKYVLRKKQVLKALSILQPIAREWYVNPNNPNHQQRMRAIAEKWGMRP